MRRPQSLKRLVCLFISCGVSSTVMAAPPQPAAQVEPAPPQRGPPPAQRDGPVRTAASSRAKQLQAPTFALDVVRIVNAVFSVSVGLPLSKRLEAGGIFAAGSPRRDRIQRFHTAEVGGYLSWFGLGNRSRGVGVTGRARYLYAWGEGDAESGGTIATSAHAFAASGLVMARYTTHSGLRIEGQGGLMWLASRASATHEGATQTSSLNVPLTTFSILLGWTF